MSDRTVDAWVEAVPRDETRSAGKDGCLQVRGYAIVWNSPSERMGNVIETIDARSLDHMGDLNSAGVRMQIEHKDLAIAHTANGTLRLSKDEKGLRIEADLDERRSDSRNLYYAVERGDISRMSFGFRIAAGGERLHEGDDGILRVHVTRIERLYEVSAVTFAAYTSTELEASPEPVDEPDDDRSWEVDILRARLDLY